MYTIQSLKVGESVTLNTAHTIVEADAGKELINTITATGDGVSDSGSAESVIVDAINYSIDLDVSITNDGTGKGKDKKFTIGDVIKYEITATNDGNMPLTEIDLASSLTGFEFNALPDIPSDEQGFKDMPWSDLKLLANDCAKNGSENYKHMLGWTKSVTASGYGTFDVRIDAFNHKDKSDGSGKAGFVFECVQTIMDTIISPDPASGAGSAFIPWGDSVAHKETLNVTLFNALPADLQNVIAEVNNECYTAGFNGSNNPSTTMVADKIWLPSTGEIMAASESWGSEGTMFAWYEQGGNYASKRTKATQSGSTTGSYWTRTPYIWSGTRNGYVRIVLQTGAGGYGYASTSYNMAPCFCI